MYHEGRPGSARSESARFASQEYPMILQRLILITAFLALPITSRATDQVVTPGAHDFGIARLKYGGGGDWYEDRTSLVNLMRAAKERLGLALAGDQEAIVEPGSP